MSERFDRIPHEAARLQIPDHTLMRRIGQGSYGDVWLARNVMGTFRAVKVVYRKGFESDRPYEREFGGIKRFEPISRSHEGFVDILQVGRNDQAGYFYYVMELADDAGARVEFPQAKVRPPGSSGFADSVAGAAQAGRPPLDAATYVPCTLQHEIQRRSRVPIEECLQLALSLTRALRQLHKQGLVHRDVKPSNIIFVDGLPKLADIGLVASLTEARSFVGTMGFIPPEGPGTPQADLYSLGKVLYEMSTGKDRNDFPELPSDARESPERDQLIELNEILLKACQNDPAKRYPSAEEMRADLALLHGGRSVKHLRIVERRLALLTRVGLVAGQPRHWRSAGISLRPNAASRPSKAVSKRRPCSGIPISPRPGPIGGAAGRDDASKASRRWPGRRRSGLRWNCATRPLPAWRWPICA
jgi:serine/threonine protein kinase